MKREQYGFKVYAGDVDSPRVIWLADGERIEINYGGATEEGYDYYHETYYRSRNTIHLSYYNNARDCDGRIDRSAEYYFDIDAPLNDTGFPEWKEESHETRDYEAEKAGY